VPLVLPPLRSRRADIVLLANHFVDLARKQHGRPAIELSPDATSALQAHSYPGNVRELRNLIERLVILSPDDLIGERDVAAALGMSGTPKTAGLYRPGVPLRVLAEEAERVIVSEALAAHAGQMAATARALGLERSHLYKKAKALGLRGERDDG